MTAVTVQSNKIVLNKVKDNQALLEPLYEKKLNKFLANPIVCFKHPIIIVNTYGTLVGSQE